MRKAFAGIFLESFFGKLSCYVGEFKLLLFELRSTDIGKSSARSVLYLYVFSDIVSWIIHLLNWSFFNREKNSGPTCPLFQQKIDVFAFSTKNRRVRFFNKKSTCPLFEAKIDVSAFQTKNLRLSFFNGKSTSRLFPLSRRYRVY